MFKYFVNIVKKSDSSRNLRLLHTGNNTNKSLQITAILLTFSHDQRKER